MDLSDIFLHPNSDRWRRFGEPVENQDILLGYIHCKGK